MFDVVKSPTPLINGQRIASPVPQPKEKSSSLGTTSDRVSKGKEHQQQQEQLESTSMSFPVTNAPSTTIAGNAVTIDLDPLLTGISPSNDKVLYSLYSDIYYNDSVSGSAVDLITMLAFGNFNLGGLHQKMSDSVREIFTETLDRLNVRTLLPEVGVDYLVQGCHLSSLIYNKDRRLFTDVMPHKPEHATFEMLPLYSQDPIITVNFPEEITKVLSKTTSPRIQKVREALGANVVDKILGGSLELEPLSTMFMPRRSFSRTDKGTSYYRRILPMYLIEKALFRGTLVESARRQRGIMHLSCGDGDRWDPTPSDLEFITEIFQNADQDPLGAIIATKLGISIEEIRQGGDFWKVGDYQDSVQTHKMRALGISEGLLSGDANYNTADQSLTVFIEMMRSFREMVTQKFFYNKLFPLISLINGFAVNKKGDVIKQDGLMNKVDVNEALFLMNDGTKLFRPTVEWTKHLKPEGDTAYMDMLSSLSDKGVPVPLRVMAAAGGLNIEDLLRQQDEDLALRTQISKYAEKIAKLAPAAAGGGEAEASALAREMLKSPLLSTSASSVQSGRGKVPLLSRNFGEEGEPYELTRTGKRKSVPFPHKQNRKIDAKIVSSIKRLNTKGKK